MVELATLQAVSYIMGSMGVFVAAIYYVMNMRQAIENRKAQLFTQITSILLQKEASQDFTELLQLEFTDFDDFARRYDSGVNPEHYSRRTRSLNYLELIGFYVGRGQLDVEHLSTINGGGFWIVWMWEKYGEVIKRYREVLGIPEYYLNFEYLAGEVSKYQKSRGYETKFDPRTSGSYNPDAK